MLPFGYRALLPGTRLSAQASHTHAHAFLLARVCSRERGLTRTQNRSSVDVKWGICNCCLFNSISVSLSLISSYVSVFNI